MSRTEALRRAGRLREALLDYGVRKVSIEIQQGRPGTPHDRWYDSRFIGSMGHHIVSLRSQGLTPGLALIKRGRSDVPGPLCNGYGGFDQIARIICMGWANHPGAGGPYTLPGGTVPRDSARPYMFGWEFEGGVREADWTDSMRDFMGRCHAATLDWLGRDYRSHIEHKTWAPRRKIDRLRYSLSEARAEIRRQPRLTSGGSGNGGVTIPSGPTPDIPDFPEDDMTPEQAAALGQIHMDVKQIRNRQRVHHTILTTLAAIVPGLDEEVWEHTNARNLMAAMARVDSAMAAETLAQQLAPLLPFTDPSGLEQALRTVLGSLDEPDTPPE